VRFTIVHITWQVEAPCSLRCSIRGDQMMGNVYGGCWSSLNVADKVR
jgi:hypothetical protein